MTLSSRPAVQWDSISTDESGNLLLYLAVHEPPAHLVVIPKTIMTEAFGAEADPIDFASSNQGLIERAIGRAWHKDRIKELIQIGTGRRLMQLWIETADLR